MTTLREAAEMALEALEVATTPRSEDRQTVLKAQAALREALAQQIVPSDYQDCHQPVAYGYRDARGNIRLLNHYETKMDRIPLYTSPPQRQPLTDEEIAAILSQSAGVDLKLNGGDLLFARAIERAHGIGGDE